MDEIRKARVADVAGIASLMTHLGYQTTVEQMCRRMRRIAADKDYVSLVAAEENSVLGFLGLAFGLYYEHDGTYARILALSVAPRAQRRGLGKKLMAVAEEIAKSRGAISCIVNSGLQRASAHRFYEALGFSWQGKALYKPLRP
jgi:GNAT superfamily N-acetyltransferase